MTKRELERILATWQRRLGLERWRLEVKWVDQIDPEENTGADCNAQITAHKHYDEAILELAPRMKKLDVPAMNRLVAHELLHLLMRDADYVIETQLEGELHPAVLEGARRAYDHAGERLVEHLARVLVEGFGLA